MPSYATIDDMLAAFPEQDLIELTDDEEAGTVNEARMLDALVKADAIVDGYVATFYKRADAVLPIPVALVDCACAIAMFKLFRHGSPTEKVEKAHDAAIARLKDIARGTFKLDQGEETIPERDGQILVESSDRLFSRDSMKGL